MTALHTLVLLLPILAISPMQEAKPKARKATVEVSFSVDEYDPSTPPRAVMKCVVHNDSPIPVRVPVGFDGGYIKVRSGQLALRLAKQSREDVRLEWVEPGRQQTIFEMPLDELLSGKGGEEFRYRWDWPRRSEPPLSPIHNYRKPGFLDSASFAVDLDIGGHTLTSEPATLKVKPQEGIPEGEK